MMQLRSIACSLVSLSPVVEVATLLSDFVPAPPGHGSADGSAYLRLVPMTLS
jgi:hypothetical protein